MAIGNIGTGAGAGTISTTVPSGGVPGGATIYVAVLDLNSDPAGTVADSASNTYSLVASLGLNNNISADGLLAVYIAENVSPLSSGNTIVYTPEAFGNSGMTCLYATGVSGLDTSVTATAYGTISAGSVTTSVISGVPSSSGDLFIGIAGLNSVNNYSSFTQDSTNGAYATPPTLISDIASMPPEVLGGGSVINAGSSALTYAPSFGFSASGTIWWAAILIGLLPVAGQTSSGSGVASIMRDHDLSLKGWYGPTILPLIDWFDRDEPVGASVLALVGKLFAQVRAYGSAKGLVPASGRSAAALAAQGRPAGALPVTGAARTALSGKPAFSLTGRLLSAGLIALTGKVSPRGTLTSLSGALLAAIAAKATPGGVLGISGRAAIQSAARVAASVAGHLAAATITALRAVAAPAGILGIIGRASVQTAARAAAASGAGHLAASASTLLRGIAAPAGVLGVSGRATAQSAARVAAVGAGHLAAATLSALRGIAAPAGALSFSGRASLQTAARAAASVVTSAIALFGAALGAIVASAVSAPRSPLSAKGVLTLRSSAAGTVQASLAAKAIAALAAKVSAVGTGKLSAAAVAALRGVAAPVGALGIRGRAAAQSAGRATASIITSAIALFGAALGAIVASAISAPRAPIAAKGVLTLRSSAAGTARASLGARAAAALAGKAAAIGKSGLLGRAGIAARAAVAPGGLANLAARSISGLAAKGAATARASLAASSAAMVHARGVLGGFAILTAISATGAIKAFGRAALRVFAPGVAGVFAPPRAFVPEVAQLFEAPLRAAATAAYHHSIWRRGEKVTFRRISGQAPNVQVFDAVVIAIVKSYQPRPSPMPVEPEGAITLGDKMVIVLDEDLRRQQFPLPLRKNDKVFVKGEWLNIERLDRSKRGVAGAIELHAKGAK
jgi:hypothetical protein